MALVKVASAIAGIIVFIGGWYMRHTLLSPEYKTVANSGSNYNSGTIGGQNKDKFVDSNDDYNKSWWGEALKRFLEDKEKNSKTISTEFRSISENKSFIKTTTNEKTNYLNQVCETGLEKTEATTINLNT